MEHFFSHGALSRWHMGLQAAARVGAGVATHVCGILSSSHPAVHRKPCLQMHFHPAPSSTHWPPGPRSQSCVSPTHGWSVGTGVGAAVGAAVGATDGAAVGGSVGSSVGGAGGTMSIGVMVTQEALASS